MKTTLTMLFLIAGSITFVGCKDDDARAKLSEYEAKIEQQTKQVTQLESDLRKATVDLNALKEVVSHLSDAVVKVQKVGDAKSAASKKQTHTAAKPSKSKAKPAKKAKKGH